MTCGNLQVTTTYDLWPILSVGRGPKWHPVVLFQQFWFSTKSSSLESANAFSLNFVLERLRTRHLLAGRANFCNFKIKQLLAKPSLIWLFYLHEKGFRNENHREKDQRLNRVRCRCLLSLLIAGNYAGTYKFQWNCLTSRLLVAVNRIVCKVYC